MLSIHPWKTHIGALWPLWHLKKKEIIQQAEGLPQSCVIAKRGTWQSQCEIDQQVALLWELKFGRPVPFPPSHTGFAVTQLYFFLPEWGLWPQCVFIMGRCDGSLKNWGNRLQFGYFKYWIHWDTHTHCFCHSCSVFSLHTHTLTNTLCN